MHACIFPSDVSTPLMAGAYYNTYISPKSSGRMHRALSLFSHGMGPGSHTEYMHKYVLEKYPYAVPYTVSANETWDFAIKMYQNIVVEAPATLTITCEVRMPIGGKIIVKPGATLEVDGGVITCAHDGKFWNGIEAWGNSDQGQNPAQSPAYQGLVKLKNGALIEHAREGFTNWHPHDWNSMGGSIRASNSTFRNCRRAAGFMAYQNWKYGPWPEHETILQPNTSRFNSVHFVVDDDYRGGDDFFAHVSMWRVDGVNFGLCTFENAQTGISQSSRLGKGIESIDAEYTVQGVCNGPSWPYPAPPCPDEYIEYSRFIGLDHGIHALDHGTGVGITTRYLSFENDVVGIYAGGVPLVAKRNQFILGGRDVVMDETHELDFALEQGERYHRGISTQGSPSFTIEGNTFHRATDAASPGDMAIVIENSGANSAQVYGNDAFDMKYGYVGEGMCMDHFHPFVGLQFLCNTNNGNHMNIAARSDYVNSGYPADIQSIRIHQGSNDEPAGNTFDQDPIGKDFTNESGWNITYWHTGGIFEPLYTSGYVTPVLAAGSNNCPGGPVIHGGLDPGQVWRDLDTAKAAYLNTIYIYNSLLDGGSTPNTMQQVLESWPQDAWELRNVLLAMSPYLSTEVLMEMMKKNILPQAMVLEICLANPEATKKDDFIRWATYEAPNPLPNYMLNLIAGSWEPKTFRMELESQIGKHHAKMSRMAELLLEYYRADTLEVRVDDLLSVWQAMPNYGARYSEMEVLLRKENYAGARDLMSNLDATYPMRDARMAERDRTLWYINQLEAIAANGRSIMQLDSAELAQWQAFAKVAADIPGRWVRNVLCFGYEICINGPYVDGGGLKSLQATRPAEAVEDRSALTVHPNPANAWATFNYEFSGIAQEAHVRVLDATGREVHRQPLNTSEGQALWDTREVPAGLYQVELINAGERLGVQKLVVQPPY